VQLAAGRDLAGSPIAASSAGASSAVNRAAKTDRASVQAAGLNSRTVSIRLEGLPNTSVLVRIPHSYRIEARDGGTKPEIRGLETAKVKHTVACEPVVSVLTAVAKQLQPGRCVT
jgi:hypothetical protein